MASVVSSKYLKRLIMVRIDPERNGEEECLMAKLIIHRNT